MNNSAAKVGEIFREAGTAFSKLSEMTMSLQPIEESPPGGKWTDEEVEMLRGCVNRFAVELNKISQHIKNRTMYHLRRLLEMDSGAIQDTSSSPPRPPPQAQPPPEYAPRPPTPTPQLTFNNYLQGFEDNNYDEDLLQSFNPEIVPPLPPEQILQPARIQHAPLFEFEDIQLDQINLDEINLVVPDLLRVLDDFTMPPTSVESDQNAQPFSQDNHVNDNESSLANIGTLHTEPAPTEYGNNDVSGAFSNIGNETKSCCSSADFSNACHFSIHSDVAKWDIIKAEIMKSSPIQNRQFTLFKAGDTGGHDSSYTGQIKITELPSGHFKSVTGPAGSSRSDDRPFSIFNFRRTENIPCTTTSASESTESKEENKVKEKFDFFKYAQAKREEQSDNLFNFRRAIEKRDQDLSLTKDNDKNKEGSPSRNRTDDNKFSGFFSFRQPAESRTNSAFGSIGTQSSRWTDEKPDEASTSQPFKRCHSPLEIDEKATFLPIRADNKITPFSSFSRAKQVQPLGTRRSRRLSHTTAFTDFITIPAAESTSGRKREQRPRSHRRKAPADKSDEGTPAKRSRKNASGPSAKALKDKKMPNTE